MGDFFKDCNIHILPLGLGLKRISLFETQIKKYGGCLTTKLSIQSLPNVTHVAVEKESASSAAKDLVQQFRDISHLKIITIEWLSMCIKTKSKVLETSYEISKPSKSMTAESTKRKLEEDAGTSSGSAVKTVKSINVNDFACAHASNSHESGVENAAIISELQKLADAFRNSKDQWRNYAYTKAIGAIKQYGKHITSYEEAIAIPGLGEKMASKVWELLETGSLRRIQEVCEGEHPKTLELFMGIWGVGPTTAQQWYTMGYRTLKDLREKATLNSQQKIGLQYYDDINARIPRDEVTEIFNIVEREALKLYPDLRLEACGSYRRGKSTCGDIDIVMSHPTEDVTETLLHPLVTRLQEIGFITEKLVKIDETTSHKKFFGLCKLPGLGHQHRRLDLFVIRWAERGPALLHYTGSAMFNRSMRNLAQKKGMSLSEHALYGVALRNGREKVAAGPPLSTPSEEDVFRLLDLPYRPPEDRDL